MFEFIRNGSWFLVCLLAKYAKYKFLSNFKNNIFVPQTCEGLTYERDVCGLTVVDSLLSINPKTRQFGENINSSKRLEVVDKDIGDP